MGSAGCAKTGSLTERLYPPHHYLHPQRLSRNDRASTAVPQPYSAAGFTDSRACFPLFVSPSIPSLYTRPPFTVQSPDRSRQPQCSHLPP
ncbi:hypothetical protein VZT92_020588 [Zoarces viviparus]|uniref:Uncharacterized protein n=1 Tax=Zoarces viviparus TaxID=48416 RepID=A0AAW1EFE8_ZOAVI